MRLSIIIPTLNEREHLPRTLAHLRQHCASVEIIIVDGGSTDGTREWLQEQSTLLVLDSARGRGTQQNAGAQIATGEILLFLHADCFVPDHISSLLEQTMRDNQNVGGAFLIRFMEAPESLSLRIITKGINARTLVTKTATGDQGIFVRRAIFQALGGFAAWPFFEDVKLVSDIKQRGNFVIHKSHITISGRRYLVNGPWRTTLLMYMLRLGYWAGIHPEKLFRWFVDVRPHLRK